MNPARTLYFKNKNCYNKSVVQTPYEQLYNGWHTEHCGAELAETKRPFQTKNTRKLDAIRDEIEKLNLNWEDKSVILPILMEK